MVNTLSWILAALLCMGLFAVLSKIGTEKRAYPDRRGLDRRSGIEDRRRNVRENERRRMERRCMERRLSQQGTIPA